MFLYFFNSFISSAILRDLCYSALIFFTIEPNAQFGVRFLWKVDRKDGDPASNWKDSEGNDKTEGDFSGGKISLTWTDPDPSAETANRKFTIYAGYDKDHNTILEESEYDRQLDLVVVKLHSLKIRQSTFVPDNDKEDTVTNDNVPEDIRLFACQNETSGIAEIDIEPSWFPSDAEPIEFYHHFYWKITDLSGSPVTTSIWESTQGVCEPEHTADFTDPYPGNTSNNLEQRDFKIYAGYDFDGDGDLDTADGSHEQTRLLEITVVKILFQSEDMAYLETPHRVGISSPDFGHDRTQHLIARVLPESAGELTYSVIPYNEKVLVSNVTQDNTQINFDIVGLEETDPAFPEGDTAIIVETALFNYLHPVVVIIPYQISNIHPQPSGPVTPENVCLNKYTSPAVVASWDGYVWFKTAYLHWLNILVLDQFDQNSGLARHIGDLYEGAEVFEGPQRPINQQIDENGCYLDPVGFIPDASEDLCGVISPYLCEVNCQECLDWTENEDYVPLGVKPANLPFSVNIDGFLLYPDPAISNRIATPIPPNTVNITW